MKLVDPAAAETDLKKQAELWGQYQDHGRRGELIVLFQPMYQVGVRKT